MDPGEPSTAIIHYTVLLISVLTVKENTFYISITPMYVSTTRHYQEQSIFTINNSYQSFLFDLPHTHNKDSDLTTHLLNLAVSV